MFGFYPFASAPFAANAINGPSNAYTITANNGSYALAGQSATLLRSKNIAASNGTYTVSGQSATLSQNRSVIGDAGSYTMVGTAATIQKTKILVAAAGQYAMLGQYADIVYSGSPSPIVGDEQLLVKLRSFTERRRF